MAIMNNIGDTPVKNHLPPPSATHSKVKREDESPASLLTQFGQTLTAAAVGGAGGVATYIPSFGTTTVLGQFVQDQLKQVSPTGAKVWPYIQNTLAGGAHVLGNSLAGYLTNLAGRKVGIGTYGNGPRFTDALAAAGATEVVRRMDDFIKKDAPFYWFTGSIGAGAALEQNDNAIRAAQNGTDPRTLIDSAKIAGQKFGYGAAAAFATGATAQLFQGLLGGKYKSLKDADPTTLSNIFTGLGGLKEMASRGTAAAIGTGLTNLSDNPFAKGALFISGWALRNDIRKGGEAVKDAFYKVIDAAFNQGSEFEDIEMGHIMKRDERTTEVARIARELKDAGFTREQAKAAFDRFIEQGEPLNKQQQKDLTQFLKDNWQEIEAEQQKILLEAAPTGKPRPGHHISVTDTSQGPGKSGEFHEYYDLHSNDSDYSDYSGGKELKNGKYGTSNYSSIREHTKAIGTKAYNDLTENLTVDQQREFLRSLVEHPMKVSMTYEDKDGAYGIYKVPASGHWDYQTSLSLSQVDNTEDGDINALLKKVLTEDLPEKFYNYAKNYIEKGSDEEGGHYDEGATDTGSIDMELVLSPGKHGNRSVTDTSTVPGNERGLPLGDILRAADTPSGTKLPYKDFSEFEDAASNGEDVRYYKDYNDNLSDPTKLSPFVVAKNAYDGLRPVSDFYKPINDSGSSIQSSNYALVLDKEILLPIRGDNDPSQYGFIRIGENEVRKTLYSEDGTRHEWVATKNDAADGGYDWFPVLDHNRDWFTEGGEQAHTRATLTDISGYDPKATEDDDKSQGFLPDPRDKIRAGAEEAYAGQKIIQAIGSLFFGRVSSSLLPKWLPEWVTRSAKLKVD